MSTVRLVMAREPIPAGPKIFLAGPTSDKSAPVPSWRPEAARLLARQWTGEQLLTVLSPESRHGERAECYEDLRLGDRRPRWRHGDSLLDSP
ncbi:hypothetical protein [Streptomyces rochei]|uniref:hypothetical protein n=1 Tax=Streptomyces rochei TaxID=1928 RepID=UPI00367DB276